ncbi:hypothetical protein SNE40_016960 [Patella caerulea]|uniref:Coiled-coil domain-containing protein 191 n=1 Tax=Patella caerulea TaxID=87958 RepID=A0AAN8JFT3_PATCE
MAENYHKPGLYKWKRQTNPRVVSSSQRVRSNNDIQNWIQKVEEASNLAADVAFSSGVKSTSGRQRGKQSALQATEKLLYHDEACTEAEELLTQWMNEKVILNDEIDDEYIADVWNQRTIESDVKKEWDYLLADDEDGEEEAYKMSISRKRSESPDPYQHLYEGDESEAVASILQNMMKKDVVKETFKKDLGFEENKPDPRLKMELRHKQVKENREKREREIEKARREKQSRKDAHLQAKKIVLKEEKEKEVKSKREEFEIQKEMVKIRKQLQEERQTKEEEKLRKKEAKLDKEMKARQDWEKQRQEDEIKMLEHQRAIDERKKIVMKKMSEIQTKQMSKNLRILHQHFTAWYELILQKRLVLGKCRAMSDWKLLLRAWNAWKSYSRSKKLDKETRQHERNILESHRKNQIANRHYKTVLVQKYFSAWMLWVQQEQDKHELEQAQEVTRQKMMALLQKAATGQLWQGEENPNEDKKIDKTHNGSQSARHITDNQKIDEVFAQNGQKKTVANNQNGPFSSKSDSSLCQTKNVPPRVPTQAWQVTRKHLNLTNEEIASLGGGDIVAEHSDKSIRKRFGTQPWMNTHFVVNNFEHRYTAQQKILSEQQNQLKEQKRLIEELQYTQKNQLLKNQLTEPRNIDNLTKEGITPRTDGGGANSNLDTSRTNSTFRSPTPRSVCTARSDNTEISTATTNLTKTTNNSKHSQIMKNMEERSAERARLKREREEKRRLMEEERLAKLKAEEAERKEEEEKEKKAKIEAYREKKKLEKKKEIEKQEEMERMRELNNRADKHYIKSVMKYRGLYPMIKLVNISKSNEEKAYSHYTSVITRKVMISWHENTAQSLTEKYNMADQMRNFLLVKHSFRNWSRYKHHMRILEQRADKFYERNVKSRIVTVWLDYATEEKMLYWQKERQAKEQYLRYLQKKTFRAWRRLPEELQVEREKEKRREEMRQKVASMLPDFEGVVRKSNGIV